MKIIKQLAICVFAICMVASLAWTLQYSKPKKKTWKEEGRTTPSKQVFSEWETYSQNLIKIESIDQLDSLISKIPLEGRLSDIQSKALQVSINNLLAGYFAPDFDKYMRFRMPIKTIKWDSNIIKLEKRVVTKYLADIYSRASLSSEERIFQGWFDYTLTKTGYNNDNNPLMDLNRLKKGFIKSISVMDSKIVVTTNSKLPEPLNLTVTKSANFGYYNDNPTFVFLSSPEDLLNKHGNVIFSILKLTLKTDLDVIIPHYFSMYWEPNEQKWLPYEYCIPSSKANNNRFAF